MTWEPSQGNKNTKRWLNLRVLMLDLIKNGKIWQAKEYELCTVNCGKLNKGCSCLILYLSLIFGDKDTAFPPGMGGWWGRGMCNSHMREGQKVWQKLKFKKLNQPSFLSSYLLQPVPEINSLPSLWINSTTTLISPLINCQTKKDSLLSTKLQSTLIGFMLIFLYTFMIRWIYIYTYLSLNPQYFY